MYKSGFSLVQALVKRYLCNSLQVSQSAIRETLLSDTHAQWTIEGLGVVATITATFLSDSNTILNFISNESVRAVQVDLSSMGVDIPVDMDIISPDLDERFKFFLDMKLSEQGGFLTLGSGSSGSARDRESKDSQETKKNTLLPPQGVPLAKNFQRRSRPSDMPDFEDEYELKCNRRRNQGGLGALRIGERDLNPPGLPKYPEMKPYIDPLAGDVSGGGMYPTADHPIFGQRSGNTSRLGVPPGARYDDPYGDDNLESMGMGLPGNLRLPGYGNSPNMPPTGGPPFGGSSFGGPPFGGGMM